MGHSVPFIHRRDLRKLADLALLALHVALESTKQGRQQARGRRTERKRSGAGASGADRCPRRGHLCTDRGGLAAHARIIFPPDWTGRHISRQTSPGRAGGCVVGTSGAGGDRPPRGYSWAPFEAGHERSVTHGATSPRRVLPLAAGIKAALLASPDCPPYMSEPRFGYSLDAWSRAEACVQLLSEWLNEAGITDAAAELTEGDEVESRPVAGGAVRKTRQRRTEPVLQSLSRWETKANALRRELGLSPSSYASLAADVSLVYRQQEDALQRMGAQGRVYVEQRRARKAELEAARDEPPAS